MLPQFRRYALHERGLRPKSFNAVRYTLNLLEKEMSVTRVEHLNKSVLQNFLYEMQEKRSWSPSTFRNHRQNLSTFSAWLVSEGLLKENPTIKISKPKLPKRSPRFLTKDEIHKIRGAVHCVQWTSQYIRIRNSVMLSTFLSTGLRLSELLNLKLEHVNLSELTIHVKMGKGRKDRQVPISHGLFSELSQYLNWREHLKHNSSFFFASEHSKGAITPKTIHRMCKKIGRIARVVFTPHQLRHTFARNAINKGLNIYHLQQILGHTDLSSTQIYLSVAQGELQRQFQSIDLYES